MCKSGLCRLLLITFVIALVDGLNILVIFPHIGKSHFMVFDGMFQELTRRGHNLTVISAFPKKTPIPNWRDISILVEAVQEETEVLDVSLYGGKNWNKYGTHKLLAMLAEYSCTSGLQNENFRNFLKEDNKFDLILAEILNTNCFLGLTKIYNAPVIGLVSSVPTPWTPDLFGSPTNPSYIPDQYLGYSDRMTFLERVENTIFFIWNRITYRYSVVIPGNEFSKKYLGIDVFDNGDIMYNFSLLLTTTHFSLNLPKPLVPSIIEVGGIHLGKPKKLPNNIEKFINESADGVVYMSLGSNIRGDSIPKERRDAFLNAFARLKQRVILKWEKEIEDKPENVLVLRWAPQFDILCHPNVKAFISHGGLGGIIEAVHCGVPIIVMPQVADQFLNSKALEASGGGLIFDLEQATEETVSEALEKILSPELKQSMLALSERFSDRPLSPMDTAVYWIEYVARHKGAPFMRTAAVDMPFYKYLLLDVIAFLVLAVFSVVYLCYKVSCFAFRKLFKKQIKDKQS